MQNQTEQKTRVFTVELKSKRNLKNVSLTNDSSNSVFLEGSIGELVTAEFAEGVILEVIGTDGIIRVDLREEELRKAPKNECEAKEQ
jgi:hypothetical protein